MTDLAGSAVATGLAQSHFAARLKRALGDPRRLLFQAFELELAERRFFLWLPVAAGTGAVWYLLADREPSLWYAGAAAAVFASLAFVLRGRRLARGIALALCCLCLGLLTTARSPDEDRPWSPAPKPHWSESPVRNTDVPLTASDDPNGPLE
jgi:competence protein ComEC